MGFKLIAAIWNNVLRSRIWGSCFKHISKLEIYENYIGESKYKVAAEKAIHLKGQKL